MASGHVATFEETKRAILFSETCLGVAQLSIGPCTINDNRDEHCSLCKGDLTYKEHCAPQIQGLKV